MRLPKISIPGAVLAVLYLAISIGIIILSSDCRGEGCIIHLFITFPWFVIFLGGGSNVLMFTVSLSLNGAIWYCIGFGLEKLGRKLFLSGR